MAELLQKLTSSGALDAIIRQELPLPMNILAIVQSVWTGER